MSRIKHQEFILVDRREQLPFSFTDFKIPTIPATINTGDYSIAVQITGDDRKKIVDYIKKYYIHDMDGSFDFFNDIPPEIQKSDKITAFIMFDKEISIERKTLDNFASDLTANRECFEDSVKRGSSLKYYAIFIEASEMDVITHRYTSRILPQSVIDTTIRWSVKHHVPILFCGNRINAEYHTYETLMGFLEYKKRGIL